MIPSLIICFIFLQTDATNNYIRGKDSEQICSDVIQSRGLAVVTVLIGVYNRKTGVPVAGVINQPFVNLDEETKR